MSPAEQWSNGASGDAAGTGPEAKEIVAMPAPGELGIKQKRSWKTWQLAVGMVVAALIGAALNYRTVGATQSSGKPAYSIDQSVGSTTTTTRSASTSTTSLGGAASGATTTTTVAGGSTTTSSAPSAAAGPPRVLMGPTQNQGNWTSPTFTTTAAGWNIGWAFKCTPAPAGGPSFQVFVTPTGSPPSGTPAISQSGPSGQSVTAQSTLGAQNLVVQAPAGCIWVVKVTGS